MTGPTVSPPGLPPVDTTAPPAHCAAVSKKPHKVEEAATPYVAKKPAVPAAAPKTDQAGQIRYIDTGTARKLTAKIFKEHDELFRKLAQ